MDEVIKRLQQYLRNIENQEQTLTDIEWMETWNDLITNVTNPSQLIQPQIGIESLDHVQQLIIKIFLHCLQSPSCNITTINLGFQFLFNTSLSFNATFFNTTLPCLLHSCHHMSNYTHSVDYNLFFHYVKLISMHPESKTLDIWNKKSQRNKCLSLIFDDTTNNKNAYKIRHYYHLCLLTPWYSQHIQDLLPFLPTLYELMHQNKNECNQSTIKEIFQCDSIKYINDVKNSITSDSSMDVIKGILCAVICNDNFNYTNFDLSQFNKLIHIISKRNSEGTEFPVLLFENLCSKYSKYIIKNGEFNSTMNEILTLNNCNGSKFQKIKDITKKMKPKMMDVNIILSVFIWFVALSMVLWLTIKAASNQANMKIFEFNHSTQYLPDLIHDNISPYFWENNSMEWHIYSDNILLIQFISLMVPLFICYDQPFHWIILYIKIYCILLFMRILTFTVTILPSALPECKNFNESFICDEKNETCDFGDVSSTFFCNDFIFSGHTTSSWLTMILYYVHVFKTRNDYIYWYESHYEQILKTYIINLVMIIQLFGAFGMLFVLTVGHVHYTVDVIIALYLVFLLCALLARSL